MGQFRENKKTEVGMIVICLIMLLPLFVISIYNRPSIDDYDYATLTHRIVTEGGNFFDVIGGAIRTSKGFYNTWQGLYTSAFLLALQPGIWGAEYYTLTTIIVLATAYICIFASFYIFNRHLLGFSKVFVAAASMVVLTLLTLRLPSAREGLFWFNGAMNYMPFAFLNLVNLALIYENYHTESKKIRIALIIGTTVLSFVISGGNHVTAFADILFLLCANVFLLYRKRKCAIVPLISAIIGFVIVYIAPGTAERQSAFEQQTILNTIIQTIKHVKNIFGEWISFTWILSMLIITPIALELIKKNKEKLPKRFPVIQILCATMVICGMFCVPFLPMGFFGAERVTNVIWITFMFLSGYLYFLILGYFYQKGYLCLDNMKETKYTSWKKLLFITICLGMIVICESNGTVSSSWQAKRELAEGTAQQYCKEVDARIEKYEDPNLEYVQVTPYTKTSDLLFMFDMTIDPDVWPNTSIGQYYGKRIHLVY